MASFSHQMGMRILLVDDHAPFRQITRELLTLEGFDIVGEAADGHAGLAEAARLRPEVVVLDIQLPDLDGFTVSRMLMATPDAPAVVLVSSREARDYGEQLGDSALPFISKNNLSGAALCSVLAATG